MEAVRSFCTSTSIYGVNVAGLPWVEIDFPYDLNRARKEVWPAIIRSRWKRIIHWRRIRWIVAGVMALILIAVGWIISLNFNSETTTWSTVLPSGGNEFVLNMPKGTQQWWIASRSDIIRAVVYGPSTVRVEMRLVLFPDIQNSEQYVVQVSRNGKPMRWKVFRSAPDQKTAVSGLVLGDRDRIEFGLPPGTHDIEVSLVAGNCEQFLARIRNSEIDSDEEEDEQ
jgi:hypothetical protein